MKKISFHIIIAISPLIIYSIFGGIFGGDHKLMFPFTLLSLFALSFFLFKKIESKKHFKLALTITLPILILFLTTTSFYSPQSKIFWYIIFIPISVYLARRFSIRKSSLLIPILSIVLFSFIGLILMPNVFTYRNNVGANVNKEFSGLSLINKNNEIVELDKSKIIVLDFWTTSCGICFKKFPDLEKYYLEFKDNPTVEFYSINVPIRRDKFSEVVELVNELDYKFPTLYATSNIEIDNLGIKAFPHLLILKNGKLRYDGRLVTDKYILVNHLKSEINKLIME